MDVGKIPCFLLEEAASVYTEKDRRTGRIRFYQERNSIGISEGLQVTMQENLQFPFSINYTIKDVTVYRASYFGGLNVAYEISNWNKDGELNGPQLVREQDNNSEKFIETITKYKNGLNDGDLKALDVTKFNFDNEGMLTDTFFMPIKDINSEWHYYWGVAEKGLITKMVYAKDPSFKDECTIFNIYNGWVRIDHRDKDIIDTTLTTKEKMIKPILITNLISEKENDDYCFYTKRQKAFRIDLLIQAMIHPINVTFKDYMYEQINY